MTVYTPIIVVLTGVVIAVVFALTWLLISVFKKG
jgi:hypothetical protein